jgi:hypothetical protein
MVRMIGLEPTRRKAPDPKSGMATNYITSATCRESITFFKIHHIRIIWCCVYSVAIKHYVPGFFSDLDYTQRKRFLRAQLSS